MKIRGKLKALSILVSALLTLSFTHSTVAVATSPWGSISFNGSQYLSSTNMSAPGTGNFTYEFWFYNTTESASNQFLMNTRSNISFPQLRDGFDVMIRPDRSLGTSYRSFWLSESPANAIKINTWYHYAFVRIGDNVYTYLNGELISTSALPSDGKNFNATGLWIGSTLNGLLKFSGNISNFRYTKASLYSSNFTVATDDFQALTDTSILLQTKNDGTFITNSISGTTFTNNGSAVASPMNPFDWNIEQARLAAQARADADEDARRKQEMARIALIKSARERIALALSSNQPVTTQDLSDADLPIKSVQSLLLAYKEMLATRDGLTKPITPEEAYAVKVAKIMKYAMYERITGVSTGNVYARELVKYGVISPETPMKELTTYQLMKQTPGARDSIPKIDAFYTTAVKRLEARKARILAAIAKNRNR